MDRAAAVYRHNDNASIWRASHAGNDLFYRMRYGSAGVYRLAVLLPAAAAGGTCICHLPRDYNAILENKSCKAMRRIAAEA